MQRADHLSEQMSYYRFFNNERIREEDLIRCAENHCISACQERNHLLLLEDTTELNMEKHRNRISSKDQLGVTGNNVNLGFFAIPV
jgi:hypothetical protein